MSDVALRRRKISKSEPYSATGCRNITLFTCCLEYWGTELLLGIGWIDVREPLEGWVETYERPYIIQVSTPLTRTCSHSYLCVNRTAMSPHCSESALRALWEAVDFARPKSRSTSWLTQTRFQFFHTCTVGRSYFRRKQTWRRCKWKLSFWTVKGQYITNF